MKKTIHFHWENRFVLTIVWGCAETLPNIDTRPTNLTVNVSYHCFSSQGMGKRKYVQPGQTQHTRSTRDLLTWRGNEPGDLNSTYRSQYSTSRPSSCSFNESEPIHVRSNLGLRRRHVRASSAPPSQRRTAPLLAWNEPDESHHGKPGVGIRQTIRNQGGFASGTPFAHTALTAPVHSPNPGQSFTVSETIIPLNAT